MSAELVRIPVGDTADLMGLGAGGRWVRRMIRPEDALRYADKANSWRGHLPSGDPDIASPGIYQVSCDPVAQKIHVSVIRTVDDDETAGGEA